MMQRQVSPRGRVTYFTWDQPHAVYHVYNHSDRLIYIDTSYNPEARIRVHRVEKSWGAEIARHTEEWYPDRRTALAAEHKAIGAENPDYNVVGTPLGREVSLAFRTGDKDATIAEARRRRADEILTSRSDQ